MVSGENSMWVAHAARSVEAVGRAGATTAARGCSSGSGAGEGGFVNRNPRNLERLRIARQPDGHHLERPGRKFWHKLELITSNRIVTAQVVHFLNGPILRACTSEWALRKQLYQTKDTSAFVNLGRVFAQRCLEAGLTEMRCDIAPVAGGKVQKFLDEVASGGVRLAESERYWNPNPWDQFRPEKPWEITE